MTHYADASHVAQAARKPAAKRRRRARYSWPTLRLRVPRPLSLRKPREAC
jgi:hypothetical protein